MCSGTSVWLLCLDVHTAIPTLMCHDVYTTFSHAIGSYGSPMGPLSGPYCSSIVSQGQQPSTIFPCPMGYPPVVPVSYDTQPPAYGDIYPQGIYDNVIDYCVHIRVFVCHIYL